MTIQNLGNVLTEKECGAKAFHLSTMLRAGYNVPKGFVLPTDIFLNHEASNGQFNPLLIEQIEKSIKSIGAHGYMVRSSAVGEDSSDSSFAGQLDSFQSSADLSDIVENIKKCWSSYKNDTVKAYQKASGKQLKGMAVIVQELIDPDIAGVVFTRNPTNEEELIIEYVHGHGENMVNGNIHPEGQIYSRTSQQITGAQDYDFNDLITTAKKLEYFYEYPLDIEWAMKDGQFYLLQSRPITTVGKGKKIFWSNTNVNENYPNPISPLLYSIARESYYHYFKNLSLLFFVSKDKIQQLESAYANVIGVFACKMYYNMSSIYSIISASPYSNLLLKSFNNFVGYVDDAELKEIENPRKWRFVLRVIKHNWSLAKSVLEFEKRVDLFKTKNRSAISFDDLRQNFHHFIEIRMHSWYRASLADFFAMIHHGTLGKFCERYYGESAVVVHNKLIQAIPNLVSSQPVLLMHDILVKLREDKTVHQEFMSTDSCSFWEQVSSNRNENAAFRLINEYVENWGFRCSGELMLSTTNYCEQPSKFIDLLKQYDQLPDNNPRHLINQKAKERKEILKSFKKQIWKKNWLFFPKALLHILTLNLLVKLASDGIRSRERVRLKQAFLYAEFKKLLKKCGTEFQKRKWISEPEDILFFRYQEIIEILNSSSQLPGSNLSYIAEKKSQFHKQSTLSYPDEFSTSLGGEYLADQKENKSESSSTNMCGLIACAGIVKGRARVLNSVMEASKLEKGDILVARQTDPGWIVVFPLIAGLIVERGGMLSHGAIVSREFGIPAIVGVENATTRIKDGELILLNADTGQITPLNE